MTLQEFECLEAYFMRDDTILGYKRLENVQKWTKYDVDKIVAIRMEQWMHILRVSNFWVTIGYTETILEGSLVLKLLDEINSGLVHASLSAIDS